MKKLITLTFALLFTAGMAYGQNTATTNSDGNGNSANVNQTANSGANIADIDQDGDDNDAKIEQVHTSSPVGTNPENVARVTQDGNDNSVELLSTVGTSNEYYIKQLGNDNKVESHANQGTNSAPSYSGDIDVLQDGNDNNVWDMDQHGYENLLEIDQLGNDNVANVEAQVSTANGFNAGDNEMFITQNGNDNKVGDNSSNGAGAYQEGVGNMMDVDQEGGASAGETDYLPSPYPNGTGFLGFSDAFFRGNAEGGQGLIQRGDDNDMYITQGSGGANIVSNAAQRGKRNEIDIDQASGGTNTANALQVSDDDISIIDQGIGTNGAVTLQRGTFNESTITQESGTNTADVMQLGGSNTSTITQDGGVNTASTMQNGSGNVSSTTQN